VNLAAYGEPAAAGNKVSAAALKQAEKDDPGLYGLPNAKLAAKVSSASVDAQLFGEDTTQILGVPDQGIAFVEYVQHTVEVGSYQVDIQTGFTDMLDPKLIQQELDAAKRAAKAAAAKKSSNSGSSAGNTTGSGPGAASTSGLANPAPGAVWGRLDMGFDGDYDMAQGAHAPFNGVIRGVGITGWPGQGRYFVVVNDDQSGHDYTRAMYFAEGATPIYGNGTRVSAGQKIGNPVAVGGTGAPGNFEIGPANTSNFDCLAKSYGLSSPGARQMVLNFYAWMQQLGAGTSTDTSAAGGP
jgi:hypothetical protein